MHALSEHTGAVRWGDGPWWMCQSAPFLHLQICDDRLIVTIPDGAYEFPRDRIKSLRCYRGWIVRAMRLDSGIVRIEHTIPDFPLYVAFSSFNIKPVCDALETAGYPVER